MISADPERIPDAAHADAGTHTARVTYAEHGEFGFGELEAMELRAL